MKALPSLAMVLIVVIQPGCVLVRPKAATVLKFRQNAGKSDYVSVGFRDAKWAMVDGSVTLVGYGWHYREHETCALVMSEPLSHNPRWLLIRSDPKATNATLCVRWPFGSQPLSTSFSPEPVEYRGNISPLATTAGKTLKLSLQDVLLRSVEDQARVFLWGRIEAKPDTEQAVRQMMQSAESTKRTIAESDGGATGSQPIRSEMNRTSSAAGSRR